MPADGVLLVDKPEGPTSRQVVTSLARLLDERKAGHAGTLDPLADGLLVVCLGRATLLSRFVGAGDKHYTVTALLGVTTDTYDVRGEVVREADAAALDERQVRRALERFVGRTEQVPPPFSAVKLRGRPLYRYARNKQEARVPARAITVTALELLSLQRVEGKVLAQLEVRCGPGTYVRGIVHDLGEALGCGACVQALKRTASGAFSVGQAAPLEALMAQGPQSVARRMLTLEAATAGMDTVVVDAEGARMVRFGKPLPAARLAGEGLVTLAGTCRVMNEQGDLLALYGPPREEDEPDVAGRAMRVIRPATGGMEQDEAAAQH